MMQQVDAYAYESFNIMNPKFKPWLKIVDWRAANLIYFFI